MISRNLFFLISVLYLVSACDSMPGELPDESEIILIAGISDEAGSYHSFQPSMVIAANQETGCLQYIGYDSLDLNSDSEYDLRITYRENIPDLFNLCCDYGEDTTVLVDCWPTGGRHYFLSESNPAFQVAGDSLDYVFMFGYGDTIQKSSEWIGSKSLKLLYIYYDLPEIDTTGYWETESPGYMGFRITGADTLYGWIKMSLGETVEIEEYYISDLKDTE